MTNVTTVDSRDHQTARYVSVPLNRGLKWRSMMRHRFTRSLYVALPLLAVLGVVGFLVPVQPVLQAASAEAKVPGVAANQIPSGVVGQPVPTAHTVYMDGSGGKKNAAKHMTALHEVMASKGWTFSGIVPHLENNDLEGWWITYVAR